MSDHHMISMDCAMATKAIHDGIAKLSDIADTNGDEIVRYELTDLVDAVRKLQRLISILASHELI